MTVFFLENFMVDDDKTDGQEKQHVKGYKQLQEVTKGYKTLPKVTNFFVTSRNLL